MLTPSIAVLVSHPIQYQVPLFRELEARDDIEITVYFCSDHGVEPSYDEGFGQEVKFEVGLLDGYDYKILDNWTDNLDRDFVLGHINTEIISEIRENDYDLICIHGWADITNWIAMISGKILGTDVLIRGDTNGIALSGKFKPAIRSVFLKALFNFVDKYGAIGSMNEQFYLNQGVSSSDIYFTPHTVDNNWFQERQVPPERIPEVRKQHGLDPELPTVLFVGKLIERKNPMYLLDSFARICSGDAQLVFVGTGELQQVLEQAALDLGIEDFVYTPGFVDQEYLPHYYSIADVFCLPSSKEPWGLVINEAMNFGLPIIASNEVGAAYDLVEDNGIRYDNDDSTALSKALKQVLFDEELRSQMSRRSEAMIDKWGLKHTADGIVEAAKDAAKKY